MRISELIFAKLGIEFTKLKYATFAKQQHFQYTLFVYLFLQSLAQSLEKGTTICTFFNVSLF